MRRLICLLLLLLATVTSADGQRRGADARSIARQVDSLVSRAMADSLAPALGVASFFDVCANC
jgi:hypothetical protein